MSCSRILTAASLTVDSGAARTSKNDGG
jgi:hypothetical protein